MDIKLAVAIIASFTAVVLAYLNYRLSRRNEKSAKKTEIRTQSYIDFISCVSKLARGKPEERSELISALADAKTRIAIYGDSKVVKELSSFDKKHGTLDSTEAIDSFLKIVVEMRVDAIGRRNVDLTEDIKQVLFGNSV